MMLKKVISRKVLVLAGIILVIGLAIFILGEDFNNRNGKTGSNGKRESVVQVSVLQVKKTDYQPEISVPGLALAYKDILITSEVSGKVKRVYFEKGMHVKRSDLLLEIDSKEISGRLIEMKSRLDLARLNYEKMQALKKVDGAISDFDLRNSKLNYEMALGAFESISAQKEKYLIRSDIDGVIADKKIEIGEMVAPGSMLCRVIDISKIKIAVALPEKKVFDIASDNQAKVQFDAIADKEFLAKLIYIASEIDIASSTFKAELEIDNKDNLILPNMSAKVKIKAKMVKGAILIPETSVIVREDGHYVFVVEDGKAVSRKIDIIGHVGDMAQAGFNIEPGDILVTKNQHSLSDNMQVMVVN